MVRKYQWSDSDLTLWSQSPHCWQCWCSPGSGVCVCPRGVGAHWVPGCSEPCWGWPGPCSEPGSRWCCAHCSCHPVNSSHSIMSSSSSSHVSPCSRPPHPPVSRPCSASPGRPACSPAPPAAPSPGSGSASGCQSPGRRQLLNEIFLGNSKRTTHHLQHKALSTCEGDSVKIASVNLPENREHI